MIWLNYLIRVPFGVIIATVLIAVVGILMTLYAIFIDWGKGWDGVETLHTEWLDMVKIIGGL